jgi:hypothetical protein
MKLQAVSPTELKPNIWNVNVVSAENERKLDASVERLGHFKPIIARELDDGTLEILGGEHRRDAAVRAGDKKINVINLGKISDIKAKEISLADNERYGEDDSAAMEKLLKDLETTSELSSFLPITDEDLDSYWNKTEFNLDDLDLDEDEDESPVERPTVSAPTHRVLRFKVQNEDAEKLSEFVEAISRSNGFTSSDALTNAGDALIHIVKELW